MRFPRRLAAAAAALALALPALPARAASGTAPAPAGNGSWAVAPATRSTTFTPRRYFALQAPPGAVVRDTVRIWNLTAGKLIFDVYGADGYNTPRDGGFALRNRTENEKDVGSWVKVSAPITTVPPYKTVDVPFTVTIPADATPGDHIGGVVALNTAVEGVEQAGAAKVAIMRAVGARIYLRVSGPLSPGIRAENVRIDRAAPSVPGTRPPRATLSYGVANPGNVRVTPTVRVTVKGAFGRTLRSYPARTLPELLPGQSYRQSLAWDSPPLLDAVTVTVQLTAGDGLVSRARAGYWAIPWLIIGGAVVAAVVLWWVLPATIRTWRRRAGIA